MPDVTLLTNQTALDCLEKAAELELQSELELALKELQPIWSDIRKKPAVRTLSREVAGLVLLRCGSILSKLASNYQVAEQERAKNLLTEAIEIFSRLNDFERKVETYNLLGWICLRLGQIHKAKTYLEISLQQPVPQDSIWRIQAHNHLAYVHHYADENLEAFHVLKKIEHIVGKCENSHLLARYHNQSGLALMSLGNNDAAIKHFELSRHYLVITDNKKYQGLVENNLACLYLAGKDYQSAHKHCDEALKIHRHAKDIAREGDTYETKAQIYFEQAKYNEALAVIDKAVNLLAKADSYGKLLKSYLTKCRILFSLDELSEALGVFAVAHELAALKIGEEKAQEVRKIFEDYLSKPHKKNISETSSAKAIRKAKPSQPKRKDTRKFELPDGLEKSGKHIVWRVNVEDFAHLRLPKGTLLLIERCETVLDNSFAVLKKDEEYYVGFVSYLKLTGHYALDLRDGEMPEPFLTEETTVFGRIVAFCPRDELSSVVKMRPLEFSV